MNFVLLVSVGCVVVFGEPALRRELTTRGAVEVVELALDRMRVRVQRVHGAAGVLGFAAGELCVALLGGFRDDRLALLDGLRMPQGIPVGRTHVVHADRRDRLHARVDLGGADDEAAAAADADRADAAAVNEALRAEVVDGGAERFGVHVRRHEIAGLAFALAPERQVNRHRDEAALGHHGGVEIGALLFHRAHRMTDDKWPEPCRCG